MFVLIKLKFICLLTCFQKAVETASCSSLKTLKMAREILSRQDENT